MRVTICPSSMPARNPAQTLTTYVLNDALAIDAGALGIFGPVETQAKIRHIFLSHSHLDHLATLPMFLDNVHPDQGECVTIHASAHVLDVLQRDLFNDRLWPDFFRISQAGVPYLKTRAFTANEPFACEGVNITPVAVAHSVECFGFLVEDEEGGIVFSSDTGPTEEIWRRAARLANLRAVFLEATFPEEYAWLAKISGHLTPGQFAEVARGFPAGTRVIAVHMPPRHYRQVARELKALRLPHLELGKPGVTYQF